MKKLFPYILCFGLCSISHLPVRAQADVKVKASTILMIKESDISNTKVVKNLQAKFGSFMRQLQQSAQAFEGKLEEDMKKIKKDSPEFRKMKVKFEAYRVKLEQLQSLAQQRMKNAEESLKVVFDEGLRKISAKYGNKAIYIAERVFAYVPDNSDEFVDVTGEFIQLIDKTKHDIAVELPVIQF